MESNEIKSVVVDAPNKLNFAHQLIIPVCNGNVKTITNSSDVLISGESIGNEKICWNKSKGCGETFQSRIRTSEGDEANGISDIFLHFKTWK